MTDTARSLAEEAAEAAIDVASDVAGDVVDLAADLAAPAITYGTKRFVSSRYVLVVAIAAAALAGIFAWRRRNGPSEEAVTATIPNISDRRPA
ncbi:MAG: hypothetical protein HKN03_15310 [Acidimicrobiales bacterium]|nr:hypothetical protein [Acidimicrobiales bacterium]